MPGFPVSLIILPVVHEAADTFCHSQQQPNGTVLETHELLFILQ